MVHLLLVVYLFYYDNKGFNGGSEEAINDDGSGNTETEIRRLGGNSKFLVDNPFNIDIHTAFMKDSEITQENFLKYFADEGYKNYEAIDSEGKAHKFTWSVNNFLIEIDDNGNEIYAARMNSRQVQFNPKKLFLMGAILLYPRI